MSDPVLDLIISKGLTYTISGKDYLIKCLNPDHEDSNPSFRIDKTTGICHCFSCGFKTNLFKYYGILTTHNVSLRVAKLKQKLLELKATTEGLEPLKGSRPFHKNYRGISSETYKHFEAFITDDVEKMEDRICFPITDVRGKTTCFVGRSLHSNIRTRYENYPSGVNIPLFPARLEHGIKSMILVEGLFDMLNLYDKGVRNAVTCFGTTKLYSNTNEKLLPYKIMGIERIYILFDGDVAGREAAIKLKPLIEAQEFTVEIIDLDDDIDPGDLDQDMISQIIEYTK